MEKREREKRREREETRSRLCRKKRLKYVSGKEEKRWLCFVPLDSIRFNLSSPSSSIFGRIQIEKMKTRRDREKERIQEREREKFN